MADDTLVGGPTLITDGWKSLKQAGFSRVDLILPNNDNMSQAYFFFKDKYVRINIWAGTFVMLII